MKEFYTAKDLIGILDFSKNTIYKYLEEGKIESKRVGKGGYRIPRAEVEKWLGEDKEKNEGKLSNGSIQLETKVERIIEQVDRDKKREGSEYWLGLSRIAKSKVDLFDWLVFLMTIMVSLTLFLLPVYFYQIKLGEMVWLVYLFRGLFLISGIFHLIFSVNKEEQYGLYLGINFWLAIMFLILGLGSWWMGENCGTVLYGAMFLVLSARAFKKETIPAVCFIWLVFVIDLMTSLLLSLEKVQVVVVTDRWYLWMLAFLLSFLALIFSLRSVKGDKKLFRLIMFLQGGSFLWMAMRQVEVGIWDRVFAYMVVGAMAFLFAYEEIFVSRVRRSKKKLIWMFVYTMIVLLTGILTMSVIRKVFRSMTESDLSRRSKIVAVETGDFLDHAKEGLIVLSKNKLMQTSSERGDVETIGELIKGLVDFSEEIERMGVHDKEGVLMTVYPYVEPDPVGVDFSLREYFQKAKAGEMYVSNLFQARIVGDPWVTMVSVPVYSDQGDFVGVLFGSLDMDELGERVGVHKKTKKGSVIVFDDNGRILVDTSEEWQFKEVEDKYGEILFDGRVEEHFSEDWSEDMNLKLRVYRRAGDYDHGVVLEESVDELEEKMIEILLLIIAITAIVLFGGIGWILEQKNEDRKRRK